MKYILSVAEFKDIIKCFKREEALLLFWRKGLFNKVAYNLK